MRRLAGRWAVGGGRDWRWSGAGMPQAAGFALKEQSTTAQGNAFAGATAGADDVSYMFFNPAALGWVDKVEVAGRGHGGGAQVRAEERQRQHRLRDADRRQRPATTTSARTRWCPPSMPAVPLPAGLRLGLGVNVPFGLETRLLRATGSAATMA